MKLVNLKNKNNSNTRSSCLHRGIVVRGQILNFVFLGCLVLLLSFTLGLSYPSQVNATRGTKEEIDAVRKNKKNPNSGKKNNNNQNQGNNNNQNQNQGGNQNNNNQNQNQGGNQNNNNQNQNQGGNQNNNNQNQGSNNQNQNQNGGNGNSNGSSNGGGNSSPNECGTAHTFFDWGCNGADDKDSILTVLVTISNWLAAGVVIAVIGGIIYGAIMYATSAGDAAKAKSATEIIRNAFIALILYFLMWAFLQYIVPGGLFN